MIDRIIEDAQLIPFSRKTMAMVIGISPTKLNNWLDRNRLWQTDRGKSYHRHYRLTDVFDLAGFNAMRIAKIPEKQCASFVYNFGFYRKFLHGNQMADFSFRNGKWDIGLYDHSAIISLRINMRIMGERIFQKIAEGTISTPTDWPDGSFESFRRLYTKAIELGRMPQGCNTMFEKRER